MKQLTAEDFFLGTLVLKKGINKGYGVVVDQEHWLVEANKEDPEKRMFSLNRSPPVL